MLRFRLFFAASLIALSPLPVLADSWDSLASISAEPTARYVCYGNADGKNITCDSTAPYVDTTGKVGIGTTSPQVALHVNNGNAIISPDGSFVIAHIKPLYVAKAGTVEMRLDSTDNAGQTGILFQGAGPRGSIYAAADYKLKINSNNAYSLGAVYINDSDTGNVSLVAGGGNVGIGTSSPAHKLDVNGNIGLAASGYVNWGATDGTTGYGFRDNAGALEFKNSGGAWTPFGTSNSFAAGTVSAPGLYVTGDSDTGFYQATANTLSITAGGVEAARFNTATSGVNYLAVTPSATGAAVQLAPAGSDTNISLAIMPKGSGGVGIGTASPGSILDIVNSSDRWQFSGSRLYYKYNGSSIPRIELGYNTAGYQGIGFTHEAWGAAAGYGAGISIAALRSLGLYTSNGTAMTERLRIDGSGNIGIATTSPSTILSFGGDAARTVGMERGTVAATAGYALTLQAGGATSGSTDKAGGDLVLQSGTATGTGTSKITFKTHPAGSTGTTDTTATTAMTILGSGYVGIGTASPSANLHAYGSSPSIIAQSSNSNDGSFKIRNVGNTDILALTTNPSAFSNITSYSYLTLNASGATAQMIFKTGGGTERMRIDNTGNVGIGIVSPAAKLDVSGDVKVAGTGSETCATAADLGKIRLNPATGRLQICRQ